MASNSMQGRSLENEQSHGAARASPEFAPASQQSSITFETQILPQTQPPMPVSGSSIGQVESSLPIHQSQAGTTATPTSAIVTNSDMRNSSQQITATAVDVQTAETIDRLAGEASPPPQPSRKSPPLKRPADDTFAIQIPPPKYRKLPYSTSRTGLIFDDRMRLHIDLWPELGDEHVERPQRIIQIYDELVGAGLAPDHKDIANEHQMFPLPIREATKEEITWIHDPAYVDEQESVGGASFEDLTARTKAGESIYFCNNSWLAATLSAGGAIVATEAVATRKVKNAVAIIRPPGHHAEHNWARGFCIFNNVCIAARAAQKYHDHRKILILDWDVHHGNGVQQAFYDDPNVLYISLHVHRDGKFYPNGDYGDHLHCGDGAGTGTSVNIPWEASGMTDADYIMAFQQVVMPISTEFNPDLVLISAGFDAAEGDPLGMCHLSPAAYAHMTHMLMQLANGKVVACLEGGYDLKAIGISALAMTRTLMGEPPDRLTNLESTPSAVATIQKVIRTQSRFWKSLYPKDLNIKRKDKLGSERLHDIIRQWQGHVLTKQHNMTEVLIIRDTISKSLKHQVLATPNFEQNLPLVVIFHDPPEAEGFPNPVSSRLDLHNTFLTDVAKLYTDWAVLQGFAVIDANIPHFVTGETDKQGFVPSDLRQKRTEHARELATYLWDNYIDFTERPNTILIGIGDSCSGLTDLLSKHPTAAAEVNLTVSFIAENELRHVASSSNEGVSSIYYRRSLVYVSPQHQCFDPAKARKLKKRHGNIIKSTEDELQDMMKAHFDEVTERILGETAAWREANQQRIALDANLNSNEAVTSDGTLL